MDSPGQMTCELKVDTQTPGWHKTLTKVLKSITGVSFTIDAEHGIARVSGKIDPDKLLLILAKAGKHAELLWVDSGEHFKNMATAIGNVQKVHDNPYGNKPMGHANGYGYYTGYGYIPYGIMDPPPRYVYPDYQHYPDYLHYQHYTEYPHYNPYYPYYEPRAMHFPQGPAPPQNPRLESLCNMM